MTAEGAPASVRSARTARPVPAALAAAGRRCLRLTLGPSLQRRVGRFTLLIVALAVLVTGLGGYLASRAAAFNAADDALLRASDMALADLGPAPGPADLERFVSTAPGLSTIVTAVVRADGSVLRGTTPDVVPVQAGDVAVAGGLRDAYTHSATTDAGALYRVRVVPLGAEPGTALLVGRPMAGTQQILMALAMGLLVCGVVAVAVAGVVGRRVARAGVAPVRELTAEVEQRAAEDDLTPVTIARNDELGRLGVAFNHLLDTVKVSRTRQARFVADAGHELRTPLTSLRTNIELLAADTDRAMLDPADRLTIMRDVRAQLVEFSALVSDLIGLTREDRAPTDFHEVDLAAVLDEAVDRVSMRAPGLGWAVHLDPVRLHGDADLLARAFTNVLDNAVKYSPPGGTVSVSLKGHEVRIGDEGGGVSEEERPFVFDRFFRSEASRATPGTGLGLSITESVVRQHGGTVAVTDAPGGGAQFVLTFPLALHRSGGAGGATDR
ncbi:sensor histidine kinase [Microlunatus antarcticus]|uniref:histidine kinase n=1 Tax=Microlunatus antarcticus TaxID=53388 RepID=A0A7W5P5L4_9ACTN|nr:two-component system sensor histidine kinase MprB [Microlunatus antarcticus]